MGRGQDPLDTQTKKEFKVGGTKQDREFIYLTYLNGLRSDPPIAVGPRSEDRVFYCSILEDCSFSQPTVAPRRNNLSHSANHGVVSDRSTGWGRSRVSKL